jgi:thiol-disulfide isomerase/thioredoxin
MKRLWPVLTAVVVVLLVAAARPIYKSRWEAGPAAGAGPEPRSAGDGVTLRFYREPKPVADPGFETIRGERLSLASLKGKVTLINFWATWCGPCKAEIPDLVALQERYRDQLQIIGVSEDEAPAEAVQRFADEHRVNYPIVMATDAIRTAFPGVSALPTSFVIDPEGRVVQRHIGLLDPVTTEHETRALAGLATRAAIERVEPDQPLGLANAAQAKEIPGVDLKSLSPERRVEVLQRLNTEACTCGCELTVAKCRIDDPACGVSLPVARRIVREMAGEAAAAQ